MLSLEALRVPVGKNLSAACFLYYCPPMSEASVAPIPTEDERTLALLAHVLQIVSGWLGPLIILLVRRQSRFVSFHALQVLLLQLASLILTVFLFVSGFCIVIFFSMTARSHVPSPAPLLMPLFLLGWFGVWIAIVVMGIVYGMRANQGEWAEYPVLGSLARKFLKIEPDRPARL